MPMWHTVICGLSGSTIFLNITSQTARFSKIIEHKMCLLIFSTIVSETLLIIHRNKGDMIKTLYSCSRDVPIILVWFYWGMNFLNRISKNNRISNFMKIRPVRAEMFMRTDGQTDTRKHIVAFRNFANSPKNCMKFLVINFCAFLCESSSVFLETVANLPLP